MSWDLEVVVGYDWESASSAKMYFHYRQCSSAARPWMNLEQLEACRLTVMVSPQFDATAVAPGRSLVAVEAEEHSCSSNSFVNHLQRH
mmetsp:Transcript_50580/g.134612  ORF Transcript_50580/g.134612 Transcript_50580/m.134612 type:complete len:88 (+) Transcript_50580:397-660(+)